MPEPDLNLLTALDILLAEGSVAGAARRLRLSPSAMSRTLARLRDLTGDPLLVRAGRGLVPSPRALELRESVGRLVQEAQAVLRPARALRLPQLERSFTLRARDGFIENFGSALLARVAHEAPGVRLHFLPKPDRDSTPLRDGRVDLETGVVGRTTSPEVRMQALFRDRLVGVVRADHPWADEAVDLARYVQGRHVGVSRRGGDRGPLDEALARLGAQRVVVATVPDFAAALAVVRDTELCAAVPERHSGRLRKSLYTFDLPVDLPGFTVSLMWHPRFDGDAAHRWLRGCIRAVCGDGDG